MRPRTPATTERRCATLYSKGLSLRQVGRAVGLTAEGVRLALVRRGVATRSPGAPASLLLAITTVDECREMRRRFGTWNDVAEILSVSRATLMRFLRSGPRKDAQVVP